MGKRVEGARTVYQSISNVNNPKNALSAKKRSYTYKNTGELKMEWQENI